MIHQDMGKAESVDECGYGSAHVNYFGFAMIQYPYLQQQAYENELDACQRVIYMYFVS